MLTTLLFAPNTIAHHQYPTVLALYVLQSSSSPIPLPPVLSGLVTFCSVQPMLASHGSDMAEHDASLCYYAHNVT